MKILRWIFLLAGLALFAVSFNLPAIRETGKAGAPANTITGYKCAVLALLQPWGKEGMSFLRSDPLTYFSVLISGWINPVFLVVLLVQFIKPGARLNWIFLVLLLIMFVFCWIVFYKIHFSAYTGYYVWMLGILVALCSDLWIKKPSTGEIAGR